MSKITPYVVLAFLMLTPFYVFSQVSTSNPDQGIVVMDPELPDYKVHEFWDYLGFKVLAGPLDHLNTYLISDQAGGSYINGVILTSNNSAQTNGIYGVIIGSNNSAQTNGEVISAEYNYDVYYDLDQTSDRKERYREDNPCHPLFFQAIEINDSPVSIGVFDTGINSDLEIFEFFSPFPSLETWGYNYVSAETQAPDDDNGHGTGMSSILALNLEHDNSEQSNIEITSFKTHNEDGQSTLWSKMKALDQAISNKVQIINMSFSYQESFKYRTFIYNPFNTLLRIAEEYNVLCVASAGNMGINLDDDQLLCNYPAALAHDNIITVGAMDCDFGPTAFSNYGHNSVDVFTTGIEVDGLDLEGNEIYYYGTSPATALVSAIASQLASLSNFPHYSNLKCAIIEGALETGALGGKCLTNGYINPQSALNAYTNCSGGEAMMGVNSNEAVNFNLENDRLNLNIETEQDQKVNIMIFNTVGQVISTHPDYITNGTNLISVDIPQGKPMAIYFAQVLVDGKVTTIKFINR